MFINDACYNVNYFRTLTRSELKGEHPKLCIFENIPENENLDDKVDLFTWKAMELREMKLHTFYTPQNIFQEHIQWTEQGKLWHFPINNEQGRDFIQLF